MVGLTIYGWTIRHDLLHWDDIVLISQNESVLTPGWKSLIRIWTEPYVEIYMPITYTLWMFEAIPGHLLRMIDGPDFGHPLHPSVYHAVSVLIYIAGGWQVLRLIRRFVHDEVAALLGALFFMAHPIQAEAVCWVSENKGLLSTFFGMLALTEYVDGARSSNRSDSLRSYWIATAWYAAALLSKPSAVALPLLAVILDMGLIRRPPRAVIRGLVVWVGMALVMVLITRAVQTSAGRVDVPLAQRPYVAADALLTHFRHLVYPVGLAAEYGRSPTVVLAETNSPELMGMAFWGGLLVGLVILAWRGYWKTLTVILLFLGPLVPNLGFIPFAFQQASTVADRYGVVALVGPSLGIALLLERWNWIGLRVVYGVILVIFSGLAVIQSSYWHDDVVLTERVVSINPKSHVFLVNRAAYYLRKQQWSKAKDDALRAVTINPENPAARLNLAKAEVQLEDFDSAVVTVQSILDRKPDDMTALEFVVKVLQYKGRYDEAIPYARKMAELDPTNRSHRLRLARLLILSGNKKEGLDLFVQDRSTPPNSIQLQEIEAQVFEQGGEFKEAIDQFRFLYNRFRQRSTLSQVRLAWLLATVPEDDLRNPSEALTLIEELVNRYQSSGEDPPAYVLDAYAAALAATGNFPRADDVAGEAITAALKQKNNKLAQEISARRELYRQGKVYLTPGPSLGDISAPAISR